MNMLNYTNINYKLLGEAIDFYKLKGFEYIEVPWYVNKKSIESTFTITNNNDFYLKNKNMYLVGSAEQSFVELNLSNSLSDNKKYCSITPCFRTEKTLNKLNQEYFIKLELFIKSKDKNIQFYLLDIAHEFFTKHSKYTVNEIETDDGIDIIINNIEVGSYGFRNNKNLSWNYGTGIAEPRFTLSQLNI